MCYLNKQNNAHSDKYQSPAQWINRHGCGDGQMKTKCKLSWTKQNKNLTQQKWPHVHRFHQTHIWSITIAQKYICTRLAHALRSGLEFLTGCVSNKWCGSTPRRQRSLVAAFKSSVQHMWSALAPGKPSPFSGEVDLGARADFTGEAAALKIRQLILLERRSDCVFIEEACWTMGSSEPTRRPPKKYSFCHN